LKRKRGKDPEHPALQTQKRHKMKKRIEVEVEIPEILDDESLALFSMLSEEELQQIKGIAIGMLLGSGRYSPDEIAAISKNKK